MARNASSPGTSKAFAASERSTTGGVLCRPSAAPSVPQPGRERPRQPRAEAVLTRFRVAHAPNDPSEMLSMIGRQFRPLIVRGNRVRSVASIAVQIRSERRRSGGSFCGSAWARQDAGDIVPPQATPQKVQEFAGCDRREVVVPVGARSEPVASRGVAANRGPRDRPTTYCPGRLACRG